jgi:L-amino acid N-acyltransferase YncA
MMNRETAQPSLTHHARQRCQQRGIGTGLLRAVLEHADVEYPAYDGKVLVSVSRAHAEELNIDDRLGRFGVVLSGNGTVITVAHIQNNRRGKAWRRGKR